MIDNLLIGCSGASVVLLVFGAPAVERDGFLLLVDASALKKLLGR